MQPAETGNLETIFFLLGLAVTFGLEAMRVEAIFRRTGFWLLAGICLIGGIGWPQFKPLWPPVTEAIASISANPVAWFVVGMFFLAVIAFQPRNENAGGSIFSFLRLSRKREFIDVTPTYLINLVSNRDQTRVQKDRMLAPYIGKWMRVSCIVGDVSKLLAFARSDDYQEDFPTTNLTISFEKNWADRFHLVGAGSRIVVVGKVSRVTTDLTLEKAELVSETSG